MNEPNARLGGIDIQALRKADRRQLGRAITLLESTRQDHRQYAENLMTEIMPDTGGAIRLGVSGVPGVGKSTFIEALGNWVTQLGHRVAILTVDPSSALSGGSILGDKTRMPELAVNSNAFIRPSPAGRTLGGVARRTREAMLICEAAGFDLVLVETVGVGQSEVMVSEMTDLFLLLLLPGAGDELQGIKRGIMELADVIAINKADGDMLNTANLMAADVRHALGLIHPRIPGWKVPVQIVSALHQQGIDDLWKDILAANACLEAEDGKQHQRLQQTNRWLKQETADLLLDELNGDDRLSELRQKIEQQVNAGTLSASVGAKQLVSRFLGR